MDIQFKKGLLDLCVLRCLTVSDSYGYKLITDISEYIETSESTLYPVLKRLEESKYVKIYKEEHNGRLRKYYKITPSGINRLKDFQKDYTKIDRAYKFILGEDINE